MLGGCVAQRRDRVDPESISAWLAPSLAPCWRRPVLWRIGVGGARARDGQTRGDKQVRTKALIVGLVAAFMWHAVTVSGAQAADQTVNIACGTDVAATINADSGSTATRFVLGSCDFTASQMIIPRDGDEIVCATPPTFTQRGPAYDPNTSCTVTGAQGVENVFRPIGQGGSIATVRFEEIHLVGGTGTPGKVGSGTGIAGGTMGDQSVLYGVEITGSDAVGMSGGHGLFDRSEVFDTTNNTDFLSFTAAGIKAIDEMHIRNSYIHDN